MTPDFMLAVVASLIFVAVLIAALTANGDRKVSDRHRDTESGSSSKDPANSNRHGDRTR